MAPPLGLGLACGVDHVAHVLCGRGYPRRGRGTPTLVEHSAKSALAPQLRGPAGRARDTRVGPLAKSKIDNYVRVSSSPLPGVHIMILDLRKGGVRGLATALTTAAVSHSVLSCFSFCVVYHSADRHSCCFLNTGIDGAILGSWWAGIRGRTEGVSKTRQTILTCLHRVYVSLLSRLPSALIVSVT